MMLLVHSAPATLAKYRHPNLGILSSPRRWYKASEGIESWRWAADNDAFSKWDPGKFNAMLEDIYGLKGCLFVTAPDVVGNAAATYRLFEQWVDALSASWQPIAYVLQDGVTKETVPWDHSDAVFIGGHDEFKMSEHTRRIVKEAQLRAKWVHMGRVNSDQRIRYAKAIGCDSIDGMKFSWFRDTYLKKGLSHAAAPAQGIL